jgi:hypothetical protein
MLLRRGQWVGEWSGPAAVAWLQLARQPLITFTRPCRSPWLLGYGRTPIGAEVDFVIEAANCAHLRTCSTLRTPPPETRQKEEAFSRWLHHSCDPLPSPRP